MPSFFNRFLEPQSQQSGQIDWRGCKLQLNSTYNICCNLLIFRDWQLMRAVGIAATCWVLATCASPPGQLEQVLLSGELRVATRNGPGTFYYGPDVPRGVDYDLARGFAEWLGVRLDIYEVDHFPQILADVRSGKAHVGAASLSETEARRNVVDFGPSYLNVQPLVIYRRSARKPNELSDLLSGRLEVLGGTSYVGRAGCRPGRAALADMGGNPRHQRRSARTTCSRGGE